MECCEVIFYLVFGIIYGVGWCLWQLLKLIGEGIVCLYECCQDSCEERKKRKHDEEIRILKEMEKQRKQREEEQKLKQQQYQSTQVTQNNDGLLPTVPTQTEVYVVSRKVVTPDSEYTYVPPQPIVPAVPNIEYQNYNTYIKPEEYDTIDNQNNIPTL